jgi:hypothetical protein
MRHGKRKREIYTFTVLHGSWHDGVISYPEMIIGTPDLNLSLSVRGMGNRKFCCKPIDGVEVTVRFVAMLLL